MSSFTTYELYKENEMGMHVVRTGEKKCMQVYSRKTGRGEII
jgi:hypothetical protein